MAMLGRTQRTRPESGLRWTSTVPYIGEMTPSAGVGDEGFLVPRFDRTVRLGEYLEHCPPNATTRGTFLSHLCDHVRQELGRDPPELYDGLTSRRWVPFQKCALSDFMKLAYNAAVLVHASLPVAEGLRRIGWLAYPSFAATMAGRVVLFAFGDRMENILEAAPNAYRLTLPEASLRVTAQGPAHYLLELRRVYSFLDSYHVGVIEGTVRAHGHDPEIRLRPRGRPSDADVDLRWR
jgi:uncharacterized protein (TIGR02265 family)